MSNWYYPRFTRSDRLALNYLAQKRQEESSNLRTPLSQSEKRELEDYLARKTLTLYDRDLDEFKEEG